MRHIAKRRALLAVLGLGLGVCPAIAQEDVGLLIRPPADLQGSGHSAAPPVAPPGPEASARVDRPGIAPPSPVLPDLTTLSPPGSRRLAGSLDGISDGPTPMIISPPIRSAEPEGRAGNPLLPPGPERAASPRAESRPEASRTPVRSRPAPEPSRASAPQGRPGLLGGLFDRLSGRPTPPAPPRPREDRPAPAGLDTEGPGASDALKETIVNMIFQREGERVSSVEVMVVGSRVLIRAEAARPWQRRALRRGLEQLPMPRGLQSTVEVR